eukprot:3933195-Rhodomonas_salina.3
MQYEAHRLFRGSGCGALTSAPGRVITSVRKILHSENTGWSGEGAPEEMAASIAVVSPSPAALHNMCWHICEPGSRPKNHCKLLLRDNCTLQDIKYAGRSSNCHKYRL